MNFFEAPRASDENPKSPRTPKEGVVRGSGRDGKFKHSNEAKSPRLDGSGTCVAGWKTYNYIIFSITTFYTFN